MTQPAAPPHQTTAIPNSSTVLHIFPAPNPRATIILQHGFGEYAERYVTSNHNLIPKLTARGISVHAMDLHGHGSSPGARGVCHVGHAVADHLSLRRSIPGAAFLLGHSLGGLVTLGSAIADARDVAGVVLTSPACPSALPRPGRAVLGLAAAWAPGRDIPIPRGREPLAGATSVSEEMRRMEGDERLLKRQVPFLVAATALDVMGEVRQGARKLDDVPVLVVHGKEDRWTDPEESRVFVDGLGGREKRLVLYERGRHELLNDVQRDEVWEEIIGFIEAHIK